MWIMWIMWIKKDKILQKFWKVAKKGIWHKKMLNYKIVIMLTKKSTR